MAVILASTPILRLSQGYNGSGSGTCGYNNQVYDPTNNPGGMDGNGVAYNWINMAQDLVSVGATAQQQAQIVASYQTGANGWLAENHALTRLSASQFTVAAAGLNLTTLYKVNRALSVIQNASGYGYVAASAYDGVSVTTVTVTGLTLDAGLTSVSLGQDPANAPGPFAGAGSSTAGGQGAVPAPGAGAQIKFLRGDATWATAGLSPIGMQIFS